MKIYPDKVLPGTLLNCAYCNKPVKVDESKFVGINSILRCVHKKCKDLIIDIKK